MLDRQSYEEKVEQNLDNLVSNNKPITFIAAPALSKPLSDILLEIANAFDEDNADYHVPARLSSINIKLYKFKDVFTVFVNTDRIGNFMIQDILMVEPSVISSKLREIAEKLMSDNTTSVNTVNVQNTTATRQETSKTSASQQIGNNMQLIVEIGELKNLIREQTEILKQIVNLLQNVMISAKTQYDINVDEEESEEVVQSNDVYLDVSNIAPEDLVG